MALPAARTVVKIRQTAGGWKPVKTAAAAEEADPEADLAEDVAALADPDSARPIAPAKAVLQATPKRAATAAAAAASVPTKRAAAKSSLLSLAKRRATAWKEEPSFDFDDPKFNKQKRPAASPKQPAAVSQSQAPEATRIPKQTGLAALARRRSSKIDEKRPAAGPAADEDDESRVRVTSKISYSGVVKAEDDLTGDLLIDCPAIEQAFGQPALIFEGNNTMGARVGSVVCFRILPHDGEELDLTRVPVATNVIVNGFQAV